MSHSFDSFKINGEYLINEVTYLTAQDVISERLGFCGCGNIAPYKYVLENLKKVEDWKDEGLNLDNYNGERNFFLHWADHNGFTEHGTSIHYCWLEDKGKEMIKDLEFLLEAETEE